MTLNYIRVRQLTHAVLPDMIERRWGRVVNISGKSEPESMVAANPAKAAIHAWSKGLSREVGKHGITGELHPARPHHERADPPQVPAGIQGGAVGEGDSGGPLRRARRARRARGVSRLAASRATSPARCCRSTAA